MLNTLHRILLAISWGKIKWTGLVACTVDLGQKVVVETTTRCVLSAVGGAVLSLCMQWSLVGEVEV